MTRKEWDFLVEERLSIMHEAGLPMARAQALAILDTKTAHGPRPSEVQP